MLSNLPKYDCKSKIYVIFETWKRKWQRIATESKKNKEIKVRVKIKIETKKLIRG